MDQVPPPPPPPPPPPLAPPEVSPPTYAPAYTSPAAPAPPRRLGRIIAIVIGIALVLVAIGGYLVAGFIVASGRISSADVALSAAGRHQDGLSSGFMSIEGRFTAIDVSSPNPRQFHADTDRFVSTWLANRGQIRSDSDRLASADRGLTASQWLTLLSRSSLDAEGTRVAHARKALAAAGTIAGGFVQDGQFLQALALVFDDIATIDADFKAHDVVGQLAAVSQGRTHADAALALTGAPDLSQDMHTFMTALEKLFVDSEAADNAYLSGQKAAGDAAIARVATDVKAVTAISPGKLAQEVQTYYQPFIDTYRSEMLAAAT
jgi:hypothetical protein